MFAHDDATAQKLGFQGGTIEGPTHFSQFAPLCERVWGKAWFESGCLSAHYRNPVFEGEEVQASIEMPKGGQNICAIGMAPLGRRIQRERRPNGFWDRSRRVSTQPPPSDQDGRLRPSRNYVTSI